MAGFIRRFSFFPGTELITQIEGVVIADLPPPGAINGVGTGTACLVGEFQDMGLAIGVAASGLFGTAGAIANASIEPTEVFSAQDVANKFGGFDSTIGQFGTGQGNGFVELQGKKCSRLLIAPVNMISSEAVRLFRDLPTNTSATSATPVVPVSAATVSAGRLFIDPADQDRVALGTRFTFADTVFFANGVDGVKTVATGTLTSAGSAFLTAPTDVNVGDICVLGTVGGTAPNSVDADTYRVVTRTATILTLQNMDGTTPSFTAGVGMAFRIHRGPVADSSGTTIAVTAAGYTLPARTLDGAVVANAVLPPQIVPAAITATSADPLSGLGMRAQPTNGIGHTAAIQAANAADSASMSGQYVEAINATLNEQFPSTSLINIIWAARNADLISTTLRTNAVSASGFLAGRMAVTSPVLNVVSQATITATLVSTGRAERRIYCWPGLRTFIKEAVGTSLGTADGNTTDTGILDTASAGWLSSVLSVLPPERNPGQAAAPVPSVMGNALAIQRGNIGLLGLNEYIALRRSGICAPRNDRNLGALIFQSGITTSLTSGETNIARRRMADFIEDSSARRLVQFSKLPLTNALKSTITAEIDAFLEGLLSPNNPPAQRIVSFSVDSKSGNTPASEAKGIFVVIAKIRLLASLDFIVLQVEAGEGVITTSTTTAA